MFCNCTGWDSKETTVSFQNSKILRTGVAFREKIMIKEK